MKRALCIPTLVDIPRARPILDPDSLSECNGPGLGHPMYRSGLMPRGMARLLLFGGPLVCLSGIAGILDAIDRQSASQFMVTIPRHPLWQLSLCIYPFVKGFKPSPSHAPVGIGRFTTGMTGYAAIP